MKTRKIRDSIPLIARPAVSHRRWSSMLLVCRAVARPDARPRMVAAGVSLLRGSIRAESFSTQDAEACLLPASGCPRVSAPGCPVAVCG